MYLLLLINFYLLIKYLVQIPTEFILYWIVVLDCCAGLLAWIVVLDSLSALDWAGL